MDEKRTNMSLIKEYVEFHYKSIADTADRLDAKLIGVAGFSGVILKFIEVSKSDTHWHTAINIASCFLFVSSVLICFIGLWPRKSGFIQEPRAIRTKNETYFESSEDPKLCETQISDSIMQGAESLQKLVQKKDLFLRGGMACLCLGAITTGIEVGLQAWA